MAYSTIMLMNLQLDYLEEKLQEAVYEPKLGVRLVHLSSTDISGKQLEHVAVKIDAGKQLTPHVHEVDGEICIPLTQGIARLGDPKKNSNGTYVMEEDKVIVDWEEAKNLVPGKSFHIPAGKAHYFAASSESPLIVFFILPATHLSTDRKFVVYPPKTNEE